MQPVRMKEGERGKEYETGACQRKAGDRNLKNRLTDTGTSGREMEK